METWCLCECTPLFHECTVVFQDTAKCNEIVEAVEMQSVGSHRVIITSPSLTTKELAFLGGLFKIGS